MSKGTGIDLLSGFSVAGIAMKSLQRSLLREFHLPCSTFITGCWAPDLGEKG